MGETSKITGKTIKQVTKINEQTSLFNEPNQANMKFNISTPATSNDAINELRTFVKEFSNKGVSIEMEEMDFGSSYQVIIKIDKN